MSDTIRDLSELLALFADNSNNQITAQDLRDFVVTANSWRAPEVNLSNNSFSTNKVTIRSPIVDLKQVAENQIFIVPADYMFLIDSMEILTTNIVGINNSLMIRFGNDSNFNAYFDPVEINGFNLGDRHIIDVAQNAVTSGSAITFGVTVASSADVHQGVGLIHGSLVKTI